MDDIQTHFLYASTLLVSKEPILINTLLGSCVAVCIYDHILKIGGMNHYMLPLWNGNGLPSPKFGNIAIEKLIEKMYSSGSYKVNLICKVFGGGDVIGGDVNVYNIGQRNIETAISILNDYNIPIVAQSVGGKQGRKIIFNTQTGEVKHNLVNRTMY